MPLKVLVVDDDSVARELIGTYVSELGCDYIETADGDEAIRAIDANTIDAVFLDIFMPVRDGFEFLKWFNGQKLDIPVIVFTDPDRGGKVSYSNYMLEFGATKAYEKPITRDKVAEAVKLVTARLKKKT